MPRKRQPQVKLHRTIRRGRGCLLLFLLRICFRAARFASPCAFAWFLGFRGFFLRRYGLGLPGSVTFLRGPLKLVQQLFVQAERLLPSIQLVPRLLRLFFVRAEIKRHIDVCHGPSLLFLPLQVKATAVFPCFWRIMFVVSGSSKPGPAFAACCCLIAILFFQAPLIRAVILATGACCTGDHCSIAAHHHSATKTEEVPMDCDHDTDHGVSNMRSCSISCCNSTEQSA